ncbi:hypothetical protein PK35_05850 [Tamlana nanhaiensis]|uniref:Lipoprotein n=1 Tax=Neotamlana nanhaiensis TaxID=1382798 RepID=A0A0D7W2R5_9FLAO|nr:hypothetical protein [Tamlana nanhaiensis]KJD33381.1 hypothetical protein PK35_05850 [Tamlana nanhaiensis]
MKKIAIYLFALIILSCNNSDDNTPDCSTVDCAVVGLFIKVIESNSGENFIENHAITTEDITVTSNENEAISFSVYGDSSTQYKHTIATSFFSSEDLIIDIENLESIRVSYDRIEPKTNQCCDFGDIENVEVTSNQNFEFDEDLNILTIFI